MTDTEFIKVANITPEFCERCDENETYALVTLPIIKKLMVKNSCEDGIELFFFKGRLARIDACYEKKDINKALNEDFKELGPPISGSEVTPLISSFEWKDKRTTFEVDYSKSGRRILGVSYIDNALQKLHDQQEKKEITNPGAH